MNKVFELILFILLIIVAIVFTSLGYKDVVIGETLCVDGNGRVNLEGIMCEDVEETWYGLNELYSVLVIPVIVFIGVLMFLRLVDFDEDQKKYHLIREDLK